MGICGNEKQKNIKYNVNDIFKIRNKNEFYFFTQFFIDYEFYHKINKKRNTELYLISKVESPNENNLLEIIKSLDQVSNLNIPKYENRFILENKIDKIDKKNEEVNSSNLEIKMNKEELLKEIKLTKYEQKDNININLEENPKFTLTLLFEKLYFSNKRKLINILKKGPPNNLRWLIWLSFAKCKYIDIQYFFHINNNDIYNKIKNILEEKNEINEEFKQGLKKCLSETKLLKENFWLINYYNLVNYITFYHRYLILVEDIHNLIFFPLVVSDGDIINTFYFLRFFFSFNYGLGLSQFFDQTNFYVLGISSITMNILKSKNKELYEHILSLDIGYDEWINNWIISFYSNILNISITIRLWDCIIALGLKFIIFYNLSFIEHFKKRILDLNTKEKFLNFFNNKLRYLYRKEEDILYLREKLIESAFNKIIEDDILKFHVVYFIKNLKINQTKKKYFKIDKDEEDEEENDDDDDEDEEEEIIKEKEIMKNNFFILFEINGDETKNEKNENNYEFRILKDFNNSKEIVLEDKNKNNENDINNNNNEIVNDQNDTNKNEIMYENENDLDKRNNITNNIENINENEDNNNFEEENRISENSDLEKSNETFEKNNDNIGLDLFDLEIREEQETKKLNTKA